MLTFRGTAMWWFREDLAGTSVTLPTGSQKPREGSPRERLSQDLCRAGSGPLGLRQGCEDRNELPEEVRPMLTPPQM